MFSSRGSSRQRNAALDHLGDRFEHVVFFDDDYVPSRFALERIEAFFAANPDVVGISGQMLADGVKGPGIEDAQADAIVEQYDRSALTPPLVAEHEMYGLYGCNMVCRSSAIGSLRFDERLPLYGWQEDVDFSMRLRAHGRTVKTLAFAGVHQGLKGGRSPGVRLGYSQTINPLYLLHKGTMRPGHVATVLLRNMIANHLRLFRSEPWVDRRGRAKGNWIGLADYLRGRLTPERAEQL